MEKKCRIKRGNKAFERNPTKYLLSVTKYLKYKEGATRSRNKLLLPKMARE